MIESLFGFESQLAIGERFSVPFEPKRHKSKTTRKLQRQYRPKILVIREFILIFKSRKRLFLS